MKNVIKFLAVVIFMTTATMQAQDKPACCAKKAEKKVEMMKEKLSLSDAQVKEIKNLLTDKTADFSEGIKAILTPEQFTKYEEMAKSCSTKNKKSCDKDKKSCSSKDKKSCCKKKGDKKSCDKKADKKSCSKDGKKKSCCKKK